MILFKVPIEPLSVAHLMGIKRRDLDPIEFTIHNFWLRRYLEKEFYSAKEITV